MIIIKFYKGNLKRATKLADDEEGNLTPQNWLKVMNFTSKLFNEEIIFFRN
jgi:hypothetical protein